MGCRQNGVDTSKCVIPTEHELHKLDESLGIATGETYRTIVLGGDPEVLNKKLEMIGIQLEPYGVVPKEKRENWKSLMQQLNISPKYWYDQWKIQHEPKIESLQ